MKIAMLTSFYAPHQGGTERYVKDLSEALAERGHEITIFTHTAAEKRTSEKNRIPRISIERLKALWLGYLPINLSNLNKRLASFDIIHSHIPPFAFEGKISKDLPQVVTYHCDSVLPPTYRGYTIPNFIRTTFQRKAEKKAGIILDKASAIITTSQDYAQSSAVLKNRSCHALPIGLNPELWERGISDKASSNSIPTFTFIGRLAASKGVNILLEAVEILSKRNEKFKLNIIGEGEERQNLEKLRNRLKIDDQVHFWGRTSRSDLLDKLSTSRALILPSLSPLEAFGIVQQEALAHGVPVIASNLPGVRQVIGDTGGDVWWSPATPWLWPM